MDNTNVDDFLAHYGKKGMKWGVTTTPKSVKTARKRATKYARVAISNNIDTNEANRRASLEGKSTGKKVASTVLALGGQMSGTHITRAAGFTKGQSTAIAMLSGGPLYGPLGATLATELKIRKDVRSLVG
jgi:hypothetical protein